MAGFTVAMLSRDNETALSAIDRSLELNTSYATGLAFSAIVRAYAGDYDTAIEHAQRAIRLNPLDPMGAQPYISLVFAYLPLGRLEEAAAAAAKAIQLNPKFSYAHAMNIICMVKLKRMDAARAAAARLLELVPFNIQMVTVLPMDAEITKDWAEALRSAGIPG
jgi:adenylate cyclase